MKLIKLKCPKCGKDIFVDGVDWDEFCNRTTIPVDDLGYPSCVFGCVIKKPEHHVIELGEKEFADQSELDGLVIKRLREQTEALLHSIENLKAGGIDESAIK